MPNGYMGKILRVNLSRDKIKVEENDEVFYRRYFGGRALIAYFLLKELHKGIDPLGPKNKLIFSSGVITGAPISGSGRNSIGAKSPLTGGYGDSEVGGYWGAELKRAGLDAIIFEGRTKNPVYLWVKDDEAEIRDASKLWGKKTGKAIDLIQTEIGNKHARVSVIGAAGENLVRYACIMNGGKDAAGRCGLGAVMGSKMLKAVVVQGTGRVTPVDMPPLTNLSKKLANKLPGFWAHELGTGGYLDGSALTGNLPYKNFMDGEFPHYEEISGYALKETGLRIGMEACWACTVRCKKVVKINEENYKVDPFYGGPEYETLAAFGSCCGIGDLKIICKANELCNSYSIDTISCGVTIAFAMECYDKGYLDKKATDGLKIAFGNGKVLLELITLIAQREGIGDLLAEGCKRMAETLGGETIKSAVHVKGQEVPMHEPRLKRALGIGYALSSTGADHMHNLHDTSTISDDGIKNFKPFGIIEPVPLEDMGPKKVRLLLHWLNWRHMTNCLHMCMFLPWTPEEIVKITRAVTGWETSVLELAKVGERAINLSRVFNIREGFTVKDDTLPERFYQPHTSGALSKTAVDRDELHKAIQIYYKMMGWSNEGVPSREKLQDLDIAWAYNYLE
ncbi:MAG: aldehyde ferredoxin oxidoreductase family protein [Candidatus Bathyarchaeota archaeon]|nr:MAG: aldehyde ferredoxin oxidoreductase family protein [Candidatus Bathyarchaeota archaeon]